MKYVTLGIALAMLVLVTACGGGRNAVSPTAVLAQAVDTQAPTPVQPTETPLPPPPPAPTTDPNQVTTLDDVRNATIQIEAQGTFADPQTGEATSMAGRGSGFIVDPSGIAVTNNHVVAGAGLLKVWIAGDTSRSYNAKVLGVSECSDLAVIDIQGEDFPYLTWYEGAMKPGLDVYAAGYPLGEPEFTLTRGIISKARAGGETSWASVDSVVEHDARINPGNSGGPLVTADGQVVGVNYRSRQNEQQFFAINRQTALPVLEQLQAGQDVDSIGLNGEAVEFESGLHGVWAASVQSGSPADKTGLKAGDLLMQLEGIDLAIDGTMAEYCSVLRTHNPDDTLSIRVLRIDPETGAEQTLEGQLNGRELAATTSPVVEDQQTNESDLPAGVTYEQYVEVEDDTGALYMNLPDTWTDLASEPITSDNGDVIGVQLLAQPPDATVDGPAVIFSAFLVDDPSAFDPDSVLDTSDFASICDDYTGREDYDDTVYTGLIDTFTGCGDNKATIFVVAAAPESRTHAVYMIVFALTQADIDAAIQVFNTFQVEEAALADALSQADPGQGKLVSQSLPATLALQPTPTLQLAAQATSTPKPRPAGPVCPSYLHRPKPGMGLLMIENHLGEPLHIDRAGSTEKWDMAPKQGDIPGRLVLDLPPGSHEFIDNTSQGYGHIRVVIEPGQAFVSPIWYNDQAEEKVFPLDVPASCR